MRCRCVLRLNCSTASAADTWTAWGQSGFTHHSSTTAVWSAGQYKVHSLLKPAQNICSVKFTVLCGCVCPEASVSRCPQSPTASTRMSACISAGIYCTVSYSVTWSHVSWPLSVCVCVCVRTPLSPMLCVKVCVNRILQAKDGMVFPSMGMCYFGICM